MSQTYLESVSQAAERLEAAKAALPRDLARQLTRRVGGSFCAIDMTFWNSFSGLASNSATTPFLRSCMLQPIKSGTFNPRSDVPQRSY